MNRICSSAAAACFILFSLYPARADERSTSARFEAGKASEPTLIAFLKAMPKGADLHSHLGGAVYSETALDVAIRDHLYFDPSTGLFEPKPQDGRIPASDLLKPENGAYLSMFFDSASMRGLRPGGS